MMLATAARLLQIQENRSELAKWHHYETKKLKKRKQLIMNELSTENLILVWLIPDLAHLCLGDHVDFGNRKHGFGNDI